MSDWTRKLFNNMYVKTEGLGLSPAITRHECHLAIRLLQLQPSDQILDLACGHGRHSIELARQGFENITGLDFNIAAIEQAQTDAVGTNAKFVVGDMLALTYEQEFDVVLSFFSSIFYWDDQTHLRILQGIHQALKQNGRLMLDSYNPFFAIHHKLLEQHPIFRRVLVVRKKLGIWKAWLGHSIRKPGKPRVWHKTFSRFDPKTGILSGIKHMHTGSEHESHPFAIRLYTFTEVEKLLERSGFRVEKVVSNDARPFLVSSPRFVIIARKQ
jgi:SAM-dependent methyltransferase